MNLGPHFFRLTDSQGMDRIERNSSSIQIVSKIEEFFSFLFSYQLH